MFDKVNRLEVTPLPI